MVTQTMTKVSRGMIKSRSYGKMLVVAFGLAVIAVMVVHKLRERRILNLIVEDKDQQLISIDHLLQREMDLNKELSKKIDDLRPRLHILRSQKMALNGRVIELQSTIASLQDDIKVVESNLQIKNEENKMLRDTITELLKEKDAEIEQVKQANTEQLQHQGVEVQSLEDPLLNSTTATDQKVVEVDVKKVDESKGLETGSATINGEDEDGQLSDVTRESMKLEVLNESEQDAGFKEDGKRSAMSRAKRKKWRDIARNRRLRENALALVKKKVSEGESGEMLVAQSNGELDHEKHENDDEIHDTGSDAGENALENKMVDTEGARVGQNTFETEVPIGDGSVKASDNQVEENTTVEKADDNVESRIKQDHKELKENVESIDDESEKVEFQDVPEEIISSFDITTNRTLDSKNDDDDETNHGDLKETKDDALQDSEANESGNGLSESESQAQDQDDQNLHSENDGDSQETDAEEDHTDEDTQEEEEDINRSLYSQTDSGHNAIEEDQK